MYLLFFAWINYLVILGYTNQPVSSTSKGIYNLTLYTITLSYTILYSPQSGFPLRSAHCNGSSLFPVPMRHCASRNKKAKRSVQTKCNQRILCRWKPWVKNTYKENGRIFFFCKTYHAHKNQLNKYCLRPYVSGSAPALIYHLCWAKGRY